MPDRHSPLTPAILGAMAAGLVAGATLAQDIRTHSTWHRMTNDPAHFASQAGGAEPLHVQMGPEGYDPGDYVIHHGITDDSGLTSWIHDLQRMTVTLAPDTRYLVVLSAGGGLEISSDSTEALPEPGPGHALIYVRNEDPEHWRGICVLQAGNVADEHVSHCGYQGY